MRLLLDTHAFLWAVVAEQRLSDRARALIEDPANDLLVSAASAWELTIKFHMGRLPVAAPVVAAFAPAIDRLRSTELPISVEHALLAGSFDSEHADPFDRLLAAQAVFEAATLVTKDRKLHAMSVATVW